MPTEKQSIAKRVIIPIISVLFTAASSWLVYNLAWHLENHVLHHFLATVCGTLMFISITFGPLIIYPWSYSRGASPQERVCACLVIPFLWATKKCIRLSIFTYPKRIVENIYATRSYRRNLYSSTKY